MKKNTALQIIALALAFILIAGVVVGVIFWQNGNISFTPVGQEQTATPDEETPSEETPVSPIEATISDNEHIRLAMSAAVTAADNSVSQTLTATVLPSTASNKSVDWSVVWGDESNETNVTDYVTVTPSSDGSTTATVTCYKPFTGIILIVCTTREGGYTAECSVEFVGKPSSLSVSGAISPTTDSTLGSSYKLGIGTTYTFTITGENVFNQVGSSFNNYSFYVVGYGDLTMGELHHNNLTLVDNWHDEYSSTVNELKDELISVSLSDGNLVIQTKKSIEGYYRSSQRLDGGRNTYYYDKVKSVDSDAYFQVIVTEQNSGVSKSLYLRFDDNVVTGVNLSGSLTF